MERISITVPEELLTRRYITEQNFWMDLDERSQAASTLYTTTRRPEFSRDSSKSSTISLTSSTLLSTSIWTGATVRGNCREGRGSRIKELINRLSSMKGVKHAKLEAVPGVPQGLYPTVYIDI